MSILEELYNDYIDSDAEYGKIYWGGEADISVKKFNELMKNKIDNPKLRMELSDSLGEIVYTHEKQGFTLGMKYAMRMAAEIFARNETAK